MTKFDYLVPIALKLIKGLSAKPGILIADKLIAANLLAQAMHGMIERNEFPTIQSSEQTNENKVSVTVDVNGDKHWRNQNGLRHRIDGPAIEHPDGSKE